MSKKYDFNEILKEYSIEHGYSYSLPSDIYNVIIVHTIESNTFNVAYSKKDGSTKNEKSLASFLRHHIGNSLKYENMVNIILFKENAVLDLKIKILPPSKVRYSYLLTNYYAPDVGKLGKSCMRFKEMQKALNFYVKNKVKIVVVIDNNNKIHARALLWDNVRSIKLKNPFIYLDRVYTRSDMLLSLFYDLAKTNNWKRYPSTTVNEMNRNYYKEGIDVMGMCHLPYNDTFRYLHLEYNLLTSSVTQSMIEHLNCSNSCVLLNVHNNGAYYFELDPNRVREVISHNYISKKDAIFIKRYDGYVSKKNIANINDTYYSVFDDKIVKTITDGYILKKDSVVETITSNTIDKNKAIQSTKYKGFVHKSNAVYIKGDLYHKLDADIICFNNKWYHTSQCFINYDRRGMNKELATQTGYSCYPQDYTPFWKRTRVDDKNSKYIELSRKGDLIPKEHAIVFYDIVYNPIVDGIEYQEVYSTNKTGFIQLTTGELIINSPKNKQHLKKFNNKWYIKQDFEAPNKNQLMLFGDKK